MYKLHHVRSFPTNAQHRVEGAKLLNSIFVFVLKA